MEGSEYSGARFARQMVSPDATPATANPSGALSSGHCERSKIVLVTLLQVRVRPA